MLTQIAVRETDGTKYPTTPLDHRILDVLQDGLAREPKEIYTAIADSSLQLPQVHSRLRVLRNRGLIRRIPIDGGPVRGPGAGKYLRA
jgi:Fe2+ or Zn2+ uptake regulation protein